MTQCGKKVVEVVENLQQSFHGAGAAGGSRA